MVEPRASGSAGQRASRLRTRRDLLGRTCRRIVAPATRGGGLAHGLRAREDTAAGRNERQGAVCPSFPFPPDCPCSQPGHAEDHKVMCTERNRPLVHSHGNSVHGCRMWKLSGSDDAGCCGMAGTRNATSWLATASGARLDKDHIVGFPTRGEAGCRGSFEESNAALNDTADRGDVRQLPASLPAPMGRLKEAASASSQRRREFHARCRQ